MSIVLLIVAYLLFSFAGWVAVIKFFTLPHIETGYSGRNYWEPGLDVSWCECIVFVLMALLPIFNVSMNLFWIWLLRQKVNRRPLIKWPKISFPKLPQCPIAIHGRASPEDSGGGAK